jgi:hypothetical protein
MVLAWGLAVVAGMSYLVRYQMTPSALGLEAPTHWPAGLTFGRDTTKATLVMTLHPQCPCSRASLSELEQVMARSAGRLDVRILFVHPKNSPADWLDTDLWRQAKAMPNVTVMLDPDGRDSAAFGATVSGQVMLYDASGALRFSGGITDGRGHEGDNVGMLAVLSLVRDGKSNVSNTPVYGCSLGLCKLKPPQR